MARDRFGPARLDVHVDQPRLDHLKTRDRLAELFALLGIADSVANQSAHKRRGFHCKAGDGLVGYQGKERRGVFGGQGSGSMVEREIGCAAAIDGRKAVASAIPAVVKEEHRWRIAMRRDDDQ